MKKIILIVSLIVIFLPFAFSVLPFKNVKAANDPGAEGEIKTDPASGDDGNIPTPAEGIVPQGEERNLPSPLGEEHDLQYVVTQVFNVAFGLAGIIALAYLIMGGYQYITSQGNPDAANIAKSTIVNSIIGLIIVLTAFLLVNFALQQIGAGNWG